MFPYMAPVVHPNISTIRDPEQAYRLARYNRQDIAALTAAGPWLQTLSRDRDKTGLDPTMPAPLVDLLGQRNALPFYAQCLQSSLQATMQSMLYVGAAHNFMYNQLVDARRADPTKQEDPVDLFMTYSTLRG